MFLKSICAFALTAAIALAASETSPYFLLASTAELPTSDDDALTNPPVSHVHNILWRSLSSCPTKHYAVVVEPLTLSYPFSVSPQSSYVPQTQHVKSTFSFENIDGRVNMIHLLNTILMDCLDYGVLRVEQLDMDSGLLATGLPNLDQETLDKSIIYATMPAVSAELTQSEYTNTMQDRRQFAEDIMRSYFHDRDYTLVYIREELKDAEGANMSLEDEAEVPFVEGEGV